MSLLPAVGAQSAQLPQVASGPQGPKGLGKSELDSLRAKVTPRERDQIKQSADEFESLFLNIVLKSMRDTVQKSGLMDGGNAEDIYRGMLDDEYSKTMASQRSTGLADNIEGFLLRAIANQKNGDETTANPEKGEGIKAYQAQQQVETLRSAAKTAKLEDGLSRAESIGSGFTPKGPSARPATNLNSPANASEPKAP